ncbi:MAG: hypothetical protein ACREHD_17750, partial [Pirellulales bacterium]
ALYGSQILGPWQALQNQLMAATAQQVNDDQAAIATADGQIAAAKAQKVNSEEAASVSLDSQFYGAAEAFASQAGSAWVSAVGTLTGNDPGSMIVAQAAVAFWSACIANDAAAQSQIDPIEQSTLAQQLANWVSFIGQCATNKRLLWARSSRRKLRRCPKTRRR